MMTVPTDDGPRIGIALSGGGSRAIAFHLGCLRTLHREGVLQRARVMSAVSGGSVIAAMYAVHEGSFEDFERDVSTVLRTGFVKPAVRTLLTTTEGIKAVGCFFALTAFAATHMLVGLVPWVVGKLSGHCGSRNIDTGAGRWVPRRFASRTTVLRRTFDALFKGRMLGNLPEGKPKLVVIATELRTGSAFYFSKAEAGSWRVGKSTLR